MTTRAKKRIALLVGVVALLVVGAFVAAAVQRVQRARVLERALTHGLAAHDQGDHDTATRELNFYLYKARHAGVEPEPDVFLKFAESRLLTPVEDQGHYGEALIAARQARDMLPNDPRPLEMLIDIYRRLGQISERLDAADRLLRIEPRHYDALLARAVSLRLLGRNDEAMEACRQLATFYPDDLRAHEAVIELMFTVDAPAAEINRYADDLVAAHPGEVRFLLLQARVRYGTGNREGARQIAAIAAQLPIDDAESLRQLLAVLDRLEMHRESADALDRRTHRAPPGGDSFVIAAERAWKAGRIDQAREYIAQSSVEPAAASDRLLGLWALIEHDADPKSDAARAAVAELRGRTTADASRWVALVDARTQEVEPGRARELLTGAIAGEPNDVIDPFAHYYLGELELSLGEWRQATERWIDLIAREPRWVRLDLALGGVLLRNERVQDAHSVAVHAFSVAPDNIAVISLLARTFASLVEAGLADPEQIDSAKTFLGRVHERLPDNGDAKALLARLYAATGRADQARALFDEIVERGLSLTAESLRSLAAVSRRNGWGYEDRLVSRGMEGDADDPAVVFSLAISAAESGRAADGEKILRNAMEGLSGAERLAYERRLALYLDVINDPRARDALASLAESNPSDALIQIGLLESRSAWTDERLVSNAIARLRALAGENSSLWRVFEAKRLLTFDPSEKNAAQVDLLLGGIIKADPRAVQSRELAAEASIILGARDRAINLLIEALAADPQRLPVYPRLIELLQEAGDTDRAERYLRLFAERPNTPSDFRRRRAALLVQQGMWTLAAADLEALAAEGDPRDRLSLAQLHRKRGDIGRARAEFDKLIAQPDAGAVVLVAAADFYAAVGQVERGREIIMRLPDEPAGLRDAMLAGFLARQGEHTEAEALYKRLADSRDSPEAWNDLARYYVRRRMPDQADEALKRGQALRAGDSELAMTAGAIRRLRGDDAGAESVDEIVAALGYREDYPPVVELKQALAAFEQAPTDLGAHIGRLAAITKRHHNFAPAWQMLSLAHLKNGDTRNAVDAAQTAMRVLPAEPAPARLATEVLILAGEPERAIAVAKQWRERTLDNPLEPDLMIARLEAQLGRLNDALRRIEPYRARIVAQADDVPDRAELLASLLAAAGRQAEVEQLVHSRAAESADWGERCLRIAAHMRARPQQARAWIEAGSAKLLDAPGTRMIVAQAWYDLGVALGDHADYRRVIEAARPALDDPESGVVAASLIAASHEQIGELKEAEEMYRLALQSRPDFAPVLNNLAYLLLTSDGSADEALALATRAVDVAPAQTVFIDTKATALLKLRRLDEAAAVFQRGLEIDPNDTVLLLGLAETRVEQGRIVDAQRTFERLDALAGTSRPLAPGLKGRFDELRRRLSQLSAAGG